MRSDVEDVLDVVTRRFGAAGVSCLMIGGHAVNHYGVTRATQDIDFMIAATDATTVLDIMKSEGFTNTAIHETVMFFNRPGSPLRVDFLPVDPHTMTHLWAGAVKVDGPEGHPLWVPSLPDLLAMKVFSLVSGGARRRDRDLTDVVHLAVENSLDVERDLRPLFLKYGAHEWIDEARSRIEALRHA